MVRPEQKDLNALLAILEDWNQHLSQHDLSELIQDDGRDNDDPPSP